MREKDETQRVDEKRKRIGERTDKKKSKKSGVLLPVTRSVEKYVRERTSPLACSSWA